MRPLRVLLPKGALSARAVGSALLVLSAGPTMLLFPVPGHAGGGSSSGEPYVGIRHYHTDHLGSTQVATGYVGEVLEYVRYDVYGAVRVRLDESGEEVAGGDGMRREFTGHEAEHRSGLLYAGARFYDPEIGQFLTHDPADQFASPYGYGPGDPLNGTDPSGASFLDTTLGAVVVTVFAGPAVFAAIQGYRAGGLNVAVRLGGESLFLSAVGSVAGGGIGAVVGSAGAWVGVSLQVSATIAANPLVQGTLLVASTGLTVANAALGASAPDWLAYASYAVAAAGIYLAFASASHSAYVNGARPQTVRSQSGEANGAFDPDLLLNRGTEQAHPSYDPRLVSKGTDEFNAQVAQALKDSASTPGFGPSLKNWLNDNPLLERVYILEYAGANGGANWHGTQAVIGWNPTFGGGVPGIPARAPFIGLSHELAHVALHYAGGFGSNHQFVNQFDDGFRLMHPGHPRRPDR